MKFWSSYDHARYVVDPRYYDIVGPHRVLRPGLAVEFNSHELDTETAQAANGWTDEQREHVEEYLQAHWDYGKTMRALVDEADLEPQIVPDIATCLFRVTIDGEIDTCGRPAISEDGYCVKHASMTEDSPKAKPNRPAKV